MKKKLSMIIAALSIALLLAGCGAVTEAEEAIAAIGKVSMESLDAIEAAEALYNALPEGKRSKVENRQTLKNARKEYNRLSALVEDARNAINAIGEVTHESLDAIVNARAAYDRLDSSGLSRYVSREYATLVSAEDRYVEILYLAGNSLLESENYEAAYSLFSEALVNFPENPYIAEISAGAADALCAQAQKAFQSGALEQTYYLLQEITSLFEPTETVADLQKKLQQRLDSKRPHNGKVFTNTAGWGYGEFLVQAGQRDAYIKLENRDDPSKYVLFFVRAGEEAKVNVKDGHYIAKYATGEQWFDQDVLFGRDTAYTLAEDTMDFTTSTEGGYVYYQTITITLYTVVGGDLETTDIDPSQF